MSTKNLREYLGRVGRGGALHPRHVESSAVNWRLTHILRGQGAIFRLTCFNEGTLGSKNHLVSFKLLTILTDQGHIGHMFQASPSPGFYRRGPEVRIFKKLTKWIMTIDQTHFLYTSLFDTAKIVTVKMYNSC